MKPPRSSPRPAAKAQPKLETLEVVPLHSLRIRCGPDWRLDSTWSRKLQDYDLWYVWGGRGRMQLADRAIDLFPGRGIWMRPGRHYEAEHDPANPLGVTAVHFSLRSRARVLAPGEFAPPIEVFEPQDPDYFESVLSHVVRLASNPDSSGRAALLLKALLLEAVADAERSERHRGVDGYHRDAVGRVLALLRDPGAESLPIGELARKSGYSVDHFTRIFHRVTGESPKAHIVRSRLQRAAALLRESSQTIGQISEALGYRDVGFFSRQFKQKFGVGPLAFRRRN